MNKNQYRSEIHSFLNKCDKLLSQDTGYCIDVFESCEDTCVQTITDALDEAEAEDFQIGTTIHVLVENNYGWPVGLKILEPSIFFTKDKQEEMLHWISDKIKEASVPLKDIRLSVGYGIYNVQWLATFKGFDNATRQLCLV